MHRTIFLISVFLQCLCVPCVLSGNCPRLYPELCPGKSNHVFCYHNNITLSPVRKTDNNLILQYSNNFERNQLCNQINNVQELLEFDYELMEIARKALSHNVWYNNDICFAIPTHPNARVIHYKPLDSNAKLIADFTSVMNIRAMGCANSRTDLLCVYSDDESFMNFRNYGVNSNRYCGLDYDRFYSGICYLHNTTSVKIVNQLKSIKTIQWDYELEYVAQGSTAPNTTNLCNTIDRRQYKLSPINYHLNEINNFDVTNIIQRMIHSGVFDVLEDSENYKIGCTFYDLQYRSLRVLCVFDKVSENDSILDIIKDWNMYLETMAYDNMYTIYGLTILVYLNILIIILCMRIICKFRLTSVEEIYTHEIYSTSE